MHGRRPVRPLAGLRVLDASRVLAGPFCGQVLGDLGAEVIKVERPGGGDETRAWGPPVPVGLRTQRLLPLLQSQQARPHPRPVPSPEGVHLFHELARRSDVLLENFRAASAAKLGLSPPELLAVNPRLIVCSISGFGRTGPLSDLPGYDFAIQALSGLMSITGPVDGPPCKVGVAVTDVLTGLYAAVGGAGLSARPRQQSGHGYAIDLALLDCAVAAQVNVAQAYLTSGDGAAAAGQRPSADRAVPAVRHGRRLAGAGRRQRRPVAALLPRRRAGRTGPRTRASPTTRRGCSNRAVLVPLVEAVMRTKTTAEWQEALTAADVPHAPVWTYADAVRAVRRRRRAACA